MMTPTLPRVSASTWRNTPGERREGGWEGGREEGEEGGREGRGEREGGREGGRKGGSERGWIMFIGVYSFQESSFQGSTPITSTSPCMLVLWECPWEPCECPWLLRLNVMIPTRFTKNPPTDTTYVKNMYIS